MDGEAEIPVGEFPELPPQMRHLTADGSVNYTNPLRAPLVFVAEAPW